MISELAQHFPLQRGGGAFLIAVGLGIAGGAVAGRRGLIPGLIGGAALGVVAMAIGGITKVAFDGLGYPSWLQWAVLGLGVLVEGDLVNRVVEGNPDRDSRQFWLKMLFVVGVHFLVLTGSHGPICGVLGLACMLNAWLGLRSTKPGYLRYWLVDGLLKIAAGTAMVVTSY